VPSLDLRFADNKSLVDAVTGASLVTFTRASSGTFVDSAGVLQTAATDVPRFDHNPTTGESLGLLVEEQRTNLLLQSNGFDTTWSNSNSSETAASGTAPDGTNTAWELKDTVDGSATTHVIQQASVSFTTGLSYTFTAWGKQGTLPGIALLLPGTAFTATTATRFDLQLGTVAAAGASTTNSITAFPNGWYRCAMTMTATATATGTIGIRTATASTTSYQGDGTGTILIYGADLQPGSTPSSYIPTTTAAVTRSADVASITGSAFSSWYNSTAGTMRAQWIGASNGCRSFYCEDAGRTNSERFAQRIGGSLLQTEVTSNGVAVARSASGAGTVTYPAIITACSAYDVTNCVVAFRGDVSSTATANGGPECGEIFIGSFRGTATFANGPIAKLTYWPQLLPSSTLSVLAP
jgi:hypothetical protein